MSAGAVAGVVCAVVLHAVFLLFGGALFLGDEENHGTLQEVELLDGQDVAPEKEQEPEDPASRQDDEMETEAEEVPDAAEILRNLELAPAAAAPALDAASLSAIGDALFGRGGGAEFADAVSLSSGGRIGGTGKAGALDETLETAFSLAEIDQKPRAVFQASPLYPSQMRGRKLEGVVTVIFIVDVSGRVADPRVVKSTHEAFAGPALNAVKQWKFEPAIKAGQRVPCKMRVPIRFPPG
jgi:protein TonB